MDTTRRNQLLAFVVAIAIGVIGYRGLQQPAKAHLEGQFTCVEFASAEEAETFRRTRDIPTGSHVSNKPSSECLGVQLAPQR